MNEHNGGEEMWQWSGKLLLVLVLVLLMAACMSPKAELKIEATPVPEYCQLVEQAYLGYWVDNEFVEIPIGSSHAFTLENIKFSDNDNWLLVEEDKGEYSDWLGQGQEYTSNLADFFIENLEMVEAETYGFDGFDGFSRSALKGWRFYLNPDECVDGGLVVRDVIVNLGNLTIYVNDFKLIHDSEDNDDRVRFVVKERSVHDGNDNSMIEFWLTPEQLVAVAKGRIQPVNTKVVDFKTENITEFSEELWTLAADLDQAKLAQMLSMRSVKNEKTLAPIWRRLPNLFPVYQVKRLFSSYLLDGERAAEGALYANKEELLNLVGR